MQDIKKIKWLAESAISGVLLDVRPLRECFPDAEIWTSSQIEPEVLDTPEIYDMPLLPQTEHLRKRTYTSPKPYTAVIDGAGLSTGDNSIVYGTRTIVLESSNTVSKPSAFKFSAHLFNKKELVSGSCMVFRSASYKIFNDFYHILVDNLPRLFLLREEPFASFEEIKLLITQRLNRVEEYFLEKLIPSNVKPFFVKPGHIYKIEKLILPSFLTPIFVAHLPKPYLDYFLPKVLPDAAGSKVKRIYISRSKASRRRITNEDELIAFLEKRGFEAFHFEELPMNEQIELMHHAEAVVTPHGAALTNLLFSSDAKVFELFGIPYVKPNYYYLCKCVGNEYYYMCHQAKGIQDDFVVDLDRLSGLLDAAKVH